MSDRPSNGKKGQVAAVLVRLTEEDFGVLQAIQQPGESRPDAYLRAAREAVMPKTCMVQRRKLPLFPTWVDWGPFSPVAADHRARHLLANDWEVRVVEVQPRMPGPAVPPDDDGDDDDDEDDEDDE